MIGKAPFKPIRIPKPLMNEIKVLKSAYAECYHKKITFKSVIPPIISFIEVRDPDNWELFCTFQSSREEIQERINALKKS